MSALKLNHSSIVRESHLQALRYVLAASVAGVRGLSDSVERRLSQPFDLGQYRAALHAELAERGAVVPHLAPAPRMWARFAGTGEWISLADLERFLFGLDVEAGRATVRHSGDAR